MDTVFLLIVRDCFVAPLLAMTSNKKFLSFSRPSRVCLWHDICVFYILYFIFGLNYVFTCLFIKNNRYFRKYPVVSQFVKFSIVGTFNTFLDFAIYILLTRVFFLYFLAANIFSFSIAVTSSFILNRSWTFKNNNKKIHFSTQGGSPAGGQYLKFWLVSVIGLLGNELILYILVKNFHFYDLLAKAFATMVILFWNFMANKLWTFKV